jgi:hypothetical protein
MRSERGKSIAALMVLLFSGCAASLYVPTREDTAASAPYEDLVRGRTLYVTTCASCHSLFPPARFTEKQWVENINEMQMRAHIDDSTKGLILRYIRVARLRPGS